MKIESVLSLLAGLALAPMALTAGTTPLGTCFTYQGRLDSPYHGGDEVKFFFKLWADDTGSQQVGTTTLSPATTWQMRAA